MGYKADGSYWVPDAQELAMAEAKINQLNQELANTSYKLVHARQLLERCMHLISHVVHTKPLVAEIQEVLKNG